ncbi:hypothetical protein GN958_ATG14689 [Phytophthora infestans]|uniref:Uncharacterized protein n=1 Tax=Phytophthora infestans TaxID=4787 RepID=A0A8S9U5D4_PHYIN|nr:hypothetical protein GN958_ATG14689 [Phytophthora infestans]
MIWWFRGKARNYPPLRKIRPHDLRRAVNPTYLHSHCDCRKTIPDDMTERQASGLFRVGISNLEMTFSIIKRRLEERSLITNLRRVREPAKRQKTNYPIITVHNK